MRESVHRVLYTVVHSNAMNGIGEGTRVIIIPAEWKTVVKDVNSGITIAFGASAALLALSFLLKRRF